MTGPSGVSTRSASVSSLEKEKAGRGRGPGRVLYRVGPADVHAPWPPCRPGPVDSARDGAWSSVPVPVDVPVRSGSKEWLT